MQQVTCEVCETTQPPATLCAECGLALRLPPGVRPIADPVIEQLPGLEPTHLDPVLDVAPVALPGLEPTIQERAEVEPLYLDGFEPTAEILLDLPGEDQQLAGLEPTGEAFQRSTAAGALEVPASCPYCGHVQAGGRVCDGCGRSKLRTLQSRAERGRAFDDERQVRCRGCGALVPHHALCSDCGQPLPPLAD